MPADQGHQDVTLEHGMALEYLEQAGPKLRAATGGGTMPARLARRLPSQMVQGGYRWPPVWMVLNVFPQRAEALAAHPINQGAWRRAWSSLGRMGRTGGWRAFLTGMEWKARVQRDRQYSGLTHPGPRGIQYP